MHRGRADALAPEMQLTADGRSLAIAFPEGWLDEHPLTRADLEQEATYLKAVKYRLSYQ